jgi:hypothetical protein
VIEQLGIVAAAAQSLGKASRLPIGTVIDAFVEGENSDLFAAAHGVKDKAPHRGAVPPL